MKFLILNSGSSSIKYQIFDISSNKIILLVKGLIEKIGCKNSSITHINLINNFKKITILPIENHAKGISLLISYITDKDLGVINNIKEIFAIGHRVVHGGGIFNKAVLINDYVKTKIKYFFNLAPLHNPANYKGIVICENLFPKSKQVAVFDTAFHTTLPEVVYRYAIPEELFKKHKIRSYGFHGISHKYVSSVAMKFFNKKKLKIISLHLGNGASINAIKNGFSYDISMGFSPNSGLVMGTRSGDLDPSIALYAVNSLGYSLEEFNNIINKNSGMLGLYEKSNDMRDIADAYYKGDKKAILAYKIYTYRIKKYIGSYVANMNGVDCIIFTGGIGENDDLTRSLVCSRLEYLGIMIDLDKNNLYIKDGINIISDKYSLVDILVIPTNEEYQIALEMLESLKDNEFN